MRFADKICCAALSSEGTPYIVIGGSGSGTNGANPMDAIGINMLLEVMGKLQKN